jgi:hypothetical protein
LPPLRAAALPIGSGAWLLVLPLVALATLHRNALRAAWWAGRRRRRAPAGRRRKARCAATVPWRESPVNSPRGGHGDATPARLYVKATRPNLPGLRIRHPRASGDP